MIGRILNWKAALENQYHWKTGSGTRAKIDSKFHIVVFPSIGANIDKYTKLISLDGYNTRQFRLRTWLADGNIQDLAFHNNI
jgi:hypothetical protein